MPVNLTVGDLALAVRYSITSGASSIPPEWVDILTTTLEATSAHIDQYAGPATPQGSLNKAAIVMAAYLLDSPETRQPKTAFINSGAESLLSPWRIPRSVVV